MKRITIAVAFLALGAAGALGALTPACSGSNQEGPNVSCADLQCGKINVCAEGIIAQCADGVTVRWHACSSDTELCGYDWQIPGQYRCESAATDCEGCQPESAGCGSGGAGGHAGSGGSGGGAAGGPTGGGGTDGGAGGGASGGTGGTSAGGTGGTSAGGMGGSGGG